MLKRFMDPNSGQPMSLQVTFMRLVLLFYLLVNFKLFVHFPFRRRLRAHGIRRFGDDSNGHAAQDVGTDNHHRVGWQNLQCDRLETWMCGRPKQSHLQLSGTT